MSETQTTDLDLGRARSLTQAWETAVTERDDALAAAYRAGHSMYRLSRETGLSQSGIKAILHRHGAR